MATRSASRNTNLAERRFARKIEAQGKTWIAQPRQFTLPAPHRSYRPDFYVIEDNCFYEVVGTRQAYSQQREKIAALGLRIEGLRIVGLGVGRPRAPVSQIVEL